MIQPIVTGRLRPPGMETGMAKKTYIVARHMVGDREYKRGDRRVLDQAAAAHLIASGALIEKPNAKARASDKAGAGG